MTRRLTIEFVKEKFNERGYELLSDSYLNAHQKLDFRCDRGHEHAMTYAHFKKGSGCGPCSYEDIGDRCRLDFNIIKDSFAKEEYRLLTKNYKNSNQKLDYICKNGHKNFIQWHPWSRGRRCSICSGRILKPGERTKYTIESIRKDFENNGYLLLSNRYKNFNTKLEYKCPNGHNGKISFSTWYRGSRCKICSIEKSRNKIEDIRKIFKARGYTLLAKEYTNANLRLDYLCPEKHQNSMTIGNFRHGSECPDCANEKSGDKFRTPFRKIEESFEKEGYTLLTKTYKNSEQKLEFICPMGHEHSITWGHWGQGVRCIYCFQESNFGSNNPNWRNGLSTSPYCQVWRDNEFKGYLKERDRDKSCWNPQCNKKGTKEVFHHINYVKDDCNPMNVIKICNSCNSIANWNRDWWQSFYTEIMRRRFNYAK